MIPLGDTWSEIVALIEDAVTGSTVLSIAVQEHYQKRHAETRDSGIEEARKEVAGRLVGASPGADGPKP